MYDDDEARKYPHPAHDAIDELIEERDRLSKSNETLVRELGEIARKLGCSASYKDVMSSIDNGRRQQQEAVESDRMTWESVKKIATILSCNADYPSIVDAIAKLASAKNAAEQDRDASHRREVVWSRENAGLRAALEDAREAMQAAEDEARLLGEEIDRIAPDAAVGAAQQGLATMLAALAKDIKDPGAARNFAEMTFSWDEGILPQMPFRRAAVIFYREGGKSPAELLIEERDRADLTEAQLTEVTAQLEVVKHDREKFMRDLSRTEHRLVYLQPVYEKAVLLREQLNGALINYSTRHAALFADVDDAKTKFEAMGTSK